MLKRGKSPNLWLNFGLLWAVGAAGCVAAGAPGASTRPGASSGGNANGNHQPGKNGQKDPNGGDSSGDPRRFVAVASGARHTCALRNGGSVWCWGANESGQSGGQGRVSSDRPGAVVGLDDVAEIAVGSNFSCARTQAGKIYCWGDNRQGQLGEGDGAVGVFSSRPSALRFAGAVTQLSLGENHACALDREGAVYCWGDNRQHQVSAADATIRRLPTRVEGVPKFSAIAVGAEHSCGQSQNGEVWCWGTNRGNALGVGQMDQAVVPRRVPQVRGAKYLAAGGNRTCIADGQAVYCWGARADGAVEPSPQRIMGVADLQGLSVGVAHACLVRNNGQSYCWGANPDGRLGVGKRSSEPQTSPRAVADIRDFTQVSAGSAHTCGIRRNGQIACWGSDASGALGMGKIDVEMTDGLAPVALEETPVKIASGAAFSCALSQVGHVWCWGDNRLGQIGDASRELSRPQPVQLDSIDRAISLGVGTAHACAVVQDGRVFCWGQNAQQQLGSLSRGPVRKPVAVPKLSDAVAVVAGDRHTCALRKNRQVSCWGAGDRGQFGNGQSGPAASVLGLSDVVELSAGKEHTCARLRSGQVSCWGDNRFGQIGNNVSAAALHQPVLDPGMVVRLNGAQQIASGGNFTCAIANGGRAYCWGSNNERQLGSGTESDMWMMPVPVQDLPSVHAIAAGEAHACAAESALVRCWGRRGPALAPKQKQGQPANKAEIGPRLVVAELSAGADHTCAIAQTGAAYCWGSNARGQLGMATRGSLWSPRVVSIAR
jgi:alpha-tubulin suppressor-like RCC1 family protein